jgi:tRNA(Ile2) C34 agmatinyltransferase TiaS
MTDLKKIQDQLEKAMNELKELKVEETQLAYDYIEYANILVKNLIIADVVVPKGTLSCDCPKCGKEMTSQLVKHHHCKKCKEHYTAT